MVTTAAVRTEVPRRGLAADLRAVRIVFHREMIRFSRDGKRASAMLLQGFLWLFVMGAGLGSLLPASTGGVDMRTFLFPGVIFHSYLLASFADARASDWRARRRLSSPNRVVATIRSQSARGSTPGWPSAPPAT